MRVLVAMSGGVDSSVAAALLVAEGHEVVGATMKLWGGPSDSGCCSVADVEDARRVAQQLGIPHHVFNFTDDFDRQVVEPYVSAHAAGVTPNPCVACNRHLKFDRFARRALQLGFDRIATGHHARVVATDAGWELRRAEDRAKDQSYVLHMLDQRQLSRLLLPVGTMPKAEVRSRAAALGLRTAAKPDSQDVCFISRSGGRAAFLGDRIPFRPGKVVDAAGTVVGSVPAVELVTVGQRRGLGNLTSEPAADRTGSPERIYAVDVDIEGAVVTVGGLEALMVDEVAVTGWTWTGHPVPEGTAIEVQTSAHGCPVQGTWGETAVRLDTPVRRVAPGQSVVAYLGDRVLGGGVAA
ncbi:MAG: tRNA 2-thiouridine(34) synthase MnmA [Acidimicrobiaceae bacterium]|nr:tRNA 2-thiouridine(34) synthase MnmA [Acidimicrobiaceae bacterium]